jgi:hypothetical protein
MTNDSSGTFFLPGNFCGEARLSALFKLFFTHGDATDAPADP